MRVQLAAGTDVGQVREENQDDFLTALEGATGLVAVLDGLGGHLGGREASELAHRVMADAWRRQARLDLAPRLSRSIRAAHEAVRTLGRKRTYRGCGTTCVAIAFEGDRFVLANVGDSRAYRVRQGAIDQLTMDHTFANELVQQRLATPEAAAMHPDAETLTRCLGMETRVEIDLGTGPLEADDRFLLCSDGLYRHVAQQEMGEIVLASEDDEMACQALIDLANDRGGEDNITVAIATVL